LQANAADKWCRLEVEHCYAEFAKTLTFAVGPLSSQFFDVALSHCRLTKGDVAILHEQPLASDARVLVSLLSLQVCPKVLVAVLQFASDWASRYIQPDVGAPALITPSLPGRSKVAW